MAQLYWNKSREGLAERQFDAEMCVVMYSCQIRRPIACGLSYIVAWVYKYIYKQIYTYVCIYNKHPITQTFRIFI